MQGQGIPDPATGPAPAFRPTIGLLPVLAISAAIAGPAAGQTVAQGETVLDRVVLEGQTGGQAANEYKTDTSTSPKVLAPLEDTPKSIDVITRKEITERAQTSLTDVLRATPGVTLGTGEGGNPAGVQPTIRGNSAANDVMVDGFRSPLRTEYEVFNLESVEITKGPGGTASGTGSTGGTINLTTKVPLEGQTFNDAALSFGTGAFKRTTLDMNRSYGDLGLRLNLMYQDADSLGGRKGLISKRYGIAPSLRYRLGDATTLVAGLYYLRNRDHLDYGVPLTTADAAAPFGRGSGTADDPFLPVDVPTGYYYGINDRDFHDGEDVSAFVRIEHDFSSNLRWTTSLRAASADNAYVVSLPRIDATGNVNRDDRSSDRGGKDLAFNSQLTGETEFWGMRHTFAVGVDIANTEVTRYDITVTDPTGFDGSVPIGSPDPSTPWGGTIARGGPNTITNYKTRGVYAFDVIDIDPQWQAHVGLRFDSFDADSVALATGATNTNSSTFWNGNAGLVYKPNENGSIYVSIGTSANPGGEGNGVGGGPNSSLDPLEPERAVSYEIGTKWSIFGDRALLSAALYQTDKDNARQTNEFGETDNIGKTRARGFEIDLAGQITDRWGISAGYAYTDAMVLDAGFTDCDTGCVPSPNNNTRVNGVPMHAASLWTTYQVTDRLTLGGGANFIGERKLNGAGTVALPSQVRVDLMAAYEISESTAIRLNIHNVFDEQLYAGNRGNGWANVEPGRNFTLSLAHSF